MPRFSHVVVVVEENHSYGDIIGNRRAPYINELARRGGLLTNSFAVTHPSQPNYLALFSGSTQGVTGDSCPHHFGAANLAGQLRAAGKTFAGYSDGLPGAGYLGCTAGNYARKHSPWVNFDSVPRGVSLPFGRFPQRYSDLPALAFVIPNLAHDMHDGTVAAADSWLRANLAGYADWARTHNSLLVLTWDEDDRSAGNHIATVLSGAHVHQGRYGERVDHYRLLATLDAAFGLRPLGRAAGRVPITRVWTR